MSCIKMIQCQFSFRRPLPNDFKFELDVVCKVILIFKYILRLRKTSRHKKIDIKEGNFQILHHYSNVACIQCQFSFRRPLPNDFKFELDVVCKVILIFKYILRLRKTSRHKKIDIKQGNFQILHHYSNVACIQCQFSFWRPLPNDFKFELDVVCKVILIFKYILRLRKTSRHKKIDIKEGNFQILHHYSNMACIQCQFSFRHPLPNDFKFELDVVCKVILIFKYILRLRKTSRHKKIDIKEGNFQILHHYSNMACIQCQFSFRCPLPNDFKFELDVVCKVILILKDILRLRKTSMHKKIDIKEGNFQILHHYSNMACIQCQFSFRRPLPNDFKFELDVVCKVILIFKYILRLRKTSRHKKIDIKQGNFQILHHYSNVACIQCQFSFWRPLPNDFKFELDVVCKVILIFKYILRLRKT